MGSAIQSGIYKIIIYLLFTLGCLQLAAQDYYVDLQGDTNNVEILNWRINEFTYQIKGEEKTLSTEDVQSVFRGQSELLYMPYSSVLDDGAYTDFFFPELNALRELKTDYYRDEHFNMWCTGAYVLLELYDVDYTEMQNDLPEAEKGMVWIYHDNVGWSAGVNDDMEEDYFKLMISKYSFSRSLNDSIFQDEIKVKQKNFLEFFDEFIAPLSATQWSDKDRADYYTHILRQNGALIVLINLSLRKIDLYREAGNTSLADKLEAELKSENQSYAVSFLDEALFDFCPVYLTDAKNMAAILDGKREHIFLNAQLEVDSSIQLKEDYFLFARKGQVFETQAINGDSWKRQAITSTPVVQNAFVIYDLDNVQLMSPFPFYVRIATTSYHPIASKSEVADYKSVSKYLKKKYGISDIERNCVEVASSINHSLHSFYQKSSSRHKTFESLLEWNNSFVFDANWQAAPSMIYQGR